MAYELSSSVKYVNPILGFYTEGPWDSVFDANANIAPAIRVQGMACKIIIAGVAHIYWYRDGVLDADLVEFTPDLSGYIPLTGTALMNGDIRRTQTSGDFNQVSFRPYSLSIENNNLITFGYKVELDLNIAQSSLIVSTPTTQRGIYIQANNKIAILDDIAIYSNLSHLQIATKLGAEPYGLITKQYFDDNIESGFKIDIEYQSGALLATVYFETTATLTLCRKESTISTIEYSTNSGGSYSSIAVGVVSLAIPATTYVIFRITYVTPSVDARGNIYLEGTY